MSSSEIAIRPVRNRRDLDAFLKVPFWLHQNEPHWVPPLFFERREFLNRRKNPWFRHADAELFLAERDGRAVGRISAQIDYRWDEYQGGNDGMFGFFESVDDPAVAQGLVDAAREWLRGHGRERMLGPMDFTTNDECGLLVDGFDETPVVLMNWHPPYYRELLESGVGLEKEIDTQMWRLRMGELHEGDEFHPFIMQAARDCEHKHQVKLRNMKRSNLAAEVARFMDVYNSAWSSNWGFVPVTDEEIKFYAKNLKPVLDEDWAMIAELDGEVVGAALSLPDINQFLPKLGGRLLPLGWLRFLVGRKREIDRVRVFALGVKPEYQHLGVAAALYVRHTEMCSPDGIMTGITGWILESNEPMNRAMEGMGGTVIQRYRIYSTAL